ncbi:MAG: PAS domain S-box-containing protein, partial [Maribacter sp.]
MKKKDTDKGPIEDFVGQKHAKIELIKEQEENYLDNIINNIGDSLFVKDENSILTLVNDAFCTLFDLERDNILGKTLAADISPEEMDGFLKIDREVLKTGNENIIEESLTVRDGQTKTISTRKTRYIASNGDKYLIGVTRDITNRKNYEKELEEGEANISTILNSLPASVCVINDTGKILQVNDSWKEFADSNKTLNGIDYYSKYNYFDVCKQDIQDDNSRIILEGLLDLFANKTTEFEYEYPCHSPNRKQWFSMRADLMKSKEKQVVISHTDITFRKLDEENRKETLARLNLAVDTAKLAVWQLTVDSGELLWNDRHLKFYGISREAFNTDTEVWRNQIHPADKNYVDSRFQEVFERKSINDVNFRIIRPNGDIRYLSGSATPIVIDGKLVKVIGVNRDITESKQSEKKLKESEERIRLFTQNVPDFLLQVDRAGRINYINKTLEVLAQKDVIGSSIYSWIPKQTSEKFKDKLENVFSTGGSEIIEHAGNGLKGEPLWFETQMGPLEKSGIITQVIIVSRDITERKTAELDLKKALDKNIELKQQIEAENIYLKEELKLEGSFNEIVGSSKSLKKVLKQVEQVAKTDSTVLILGETGTGKELIAKAIHNASDRKAKPLVKVNCSALPADLIESEFFGHEKGAFTGALNRKIGRFELANGGTIFLDEIGDLPIGLQTRLLRVLQESEFERVGGEKTIKVDVRVITATNRNLKKQVLENNFRQDLYYRLNVFPIECPTLRNRVDDIPSLVHHFVNKYNPKVNNRIKTVHQKTIERLMHYNWPGNIRELENVIERAIIVNQGSQLRLGKWFMDSSIDTVVSDELKTMETVERDYIIKVLEKTNWKIRGKNGAAQLLGMQPTTLE